MAESPVERLGRPRAPAGSPLPRRRALFPKIDLERLVQRARVLRSVDLSPLLADQREGVPHQALVLERSKDRHDQLFRKVFDGLGTVEGQLGAAVVGVVVERRGNERRKVREKTKTTLFFFFSTSPFSLCCALSLSYYTLFLSSPRLNAR